MNIWRLNSVNTLENKIALVTGGSQGIGKCIADRLGKAGATLAIAALDNEALAKAADDYKAKGFRFKAYGVDLSIDAAIESLVLSITKDLGPVDVLVNNAGIGGPTGPVHKIAVEDWDKTLQINLRTPFLLSRAVIPAMIARKSGKIINMSSVAGKMPYPLRTPYAASKWGLVGLTLTLAQEVGPYNVQVNAICPGPTKTELIESVIRARAAATGTDFETMSQEYVRATALKRMIMPEEVADLALFLASSQSDAITGQAIDISAGSLALPAAT
jgi:NAD(P)-dependent dehydrogenase (short-subunit alcohol dehydrogenase family)